MRTALLIPFIVLLLGMGSVAPAEIVDRVVAVVGRRAIKQSDIINEIRYSSFLNMEKPVYDLEQQKKAADRLIDQFIIREEIESGYALGDPSQAAQFLDQIKQRYPNEAAFRDSLAGYGGDPDSLLSYLRWQATVLRFVSLRFTAVDAGAKTNDGDLTDENFFAWLDTTRKQTRIKFTEESLR